MSQLYNVPQTPPNPHPLPPTLPSKLRFAPVFPTPPPQYFPGFSLGPNVRAVPSIEEAVRDADLLVFCAPHQFMHGICKQLMGKVGGLMGGRVGGWGRLPRGCTHWPPAWRVGDGFRCSLRGVCSLGRRGPGTAG